MSLSGGQLIARVIGAAGIDGGEIRPLVPQSKTLFEGAGLACQFIVDDTRTATDLVQINITGPIASRGSVDVITPRMASGTGDLVTGRRRHPCLVP